ncbi:Asp23/Gls24 family envelope stress response protein [Streptomyces sp. V3I7]|uniref:Asp23/Gls24 family envelope stress response protein n=1 Tax=Streptomyces sp. V3I7 TaxID=3042278 RepID=UPI002785FDF1|nr:Asp23/Gls24 family envelope stress response protein [Streptomyces sp. V3I7]MDQ0990148.1 putative alkaline shock family protein YloU [Streptomyces sp. V3I7]
MTSVRGGAGETTGAPSVVMPGERGATRIPDRVVAKIAAQAAREALGSLPPDAAPPHATVVVRRKPVTAVEPGAPHESARVSIHLDLEYPSDIAGRCAAVRRHVTERVSALVGMEVPEVAVRVERLHPVPAHGALHGRTR